MLNITVIGAGNGGQAIAGYAAIRQNNVCLYNRTLSKTQTILSDKRITLSGKIEGSGTISLITDNIKIAVEFADIIMIVTTANAHYDLAIQMAPFLKDEQIIILNPGRTGGVWEFQQALTSISCTAKIYLAEAQTLIYACRLVRPGHVHIIGVKEKVLLSSKNKHDTSYVIKSLSELYTCFIPAQNILQTSLENIGAILHPPVILFNAAAIERENKFYFYRDMTKQIAHFIQRLDHERINIGKAFGLELISTEEWVSYAYPNIKGNNLRERIINNPAYFDILAPSTIFARQLIEDIPTGLLPMSELGKAAEVDVTLMESIINICSTLLNIDFRKQGRTLKRLGLSNMDIKNITNNLQ